jgi:hypothetical protein
VGVLKKMSKTELVSEVVKPTEQQVKDATALFNALEPELKKAYLLIKAGKAKVMNKSSSVKIENDECMGLISYYKQFDAFAIFDDLAMMISLPVILKAEFKEYLATKYHIVSKK